jgi:hypothetical protein
MHISSSLRVVLAVTVLTFVLCILSLRAERYATQRAAEPASETELSVDPSGSLTASHTR